MAKTQTASTIPAYRIALGHGIYEEEVAEAHEVQNYAYGYNPRVHVAFATGGVGWGSTNSPSTHDVNFPESATFTTYYSFRTYIDPDTVQILITLTATFTTTMDGEARVNIGATNTTLAFTAGTTSTQTATLNTSSTGTGEVSCTIELRQTVSPYNASQTLDYVSIQDQPVTSSLPDPPNA